MEKKEMKKIYTPEWLKENGLYWNGKTFPYNIKLKERAKEMRKSMTEAERKIWFEYFSSHKLKFVRQKIIGHYIVDFYCATFQLAIEIDGSHHFTNDGIEYDRIKSEYLSFFDVNLIRFSNTEIMHKFNDVKNKLCQILSE
jgi:very-short-patch-repair endonuclease